MNAKVDVSRSERSLAGLTGLVALILASCSSVPQPTVQQGLDYGFGTPKQAFESFRTAVQGDLLVPEYRCFSKQWKWDNEVPSILVYAEVRDGLLEAVPRLRWAIYHAEPPEIVPQRPMEKGEPITAILQARIPGPLWLKDRFLSVIFIREGYWSAVSEARALEPGSGATLADPWSAGILNYNEGLDQLELTIEEFSETVRMSPEALIELNAGWQWKILRINVFDEPLPSYEGDS